MVTTHMPVTPPSGALLVRVRVAAPDTERPLSWVRTLPAAPPGTLVTVSLSDPVLREVPTDDLVSRRYRIVGVHRPSRPASAGPSVDLLITAELVRACPAYAHALRARAERAFDLAMGPVQRVLADVLALHL